jgi:predicted DNA-binding transcriptional regulator AlpA
VADSPGKKSYIDINELMARTGLSRATVWRLKRDGKIPFFQPAGKGGRVAFPDDAIEHALSGGTPDSAEGNGDSPQRLPGPKPSWMA